MAKLPQLSFAKIVSSNNSQKCLFVGLILLAIYVSGLAYLFYLSQALAHDPKFLAPYFKALYVLQSPSGLINLWFYLWGILFLFPATILLTIGIASNSHEYLSSFIFRINSLVFKRGLLFSALVSLLAIIVIISYVYKGREIIQDESCYLFQAKTYVTGNLFVPAPPAAESLCRNWMITNWIWTAKYLWGHASILAIGLRVGSAYLSSVFMALASLLLLHGIVKEIYSKRMAKLAVLLMGTSPWFWFVSATLVTHVSMLFLLLLFIHGWIKLEHKQSFTLGVILGLCLGWAFCVRQLTTVCFAAPFAGLIIVHLWQEPKTWFRPFWGLIVGSGAVMALLLIYNTLVTGDPFILPHIYSDESNRLGFGNKGWVVFTPLKGVLNLVKSAFLMNMWLFGWPISVAPMIALFLRPIKFSLRNITEHTNRLKLMAQSQKWDILWIVLIISHCVGYFFYFATLVIITLPLYYYELIIPLTILSAKGLIFFHELVSEKIDRGKFLIPTFVFLSVITSFVFFVPFHSLGFMQRYSIFWKPVDLAASSIPEKAIVFVGRSEVADVFPLVTQPHPSPKMDDKLLFVSLRNNEEYEEAVRAFPDRSIYAIFYDNQLAKYIIKKIERGDKLSDYELAHCVDSNFDKGKIDQKPVPALSLFFMKLLGLEEKSTKPKGSL